MAEIGDRLGDPRRIIHGRDNGTLITGHTNMPRQKGTGPDIPYGAGVVTDRQAEDRSRKITDGWIRAANLEIDRHGNRRISARATAWAAGSVATAGTIICLLTLSR